MNYDPIYNDYPIWKMTVDTKKDGIRLLSASALSDTFPMYHPALMARHLSVFCETWQLEPCWSIDVRYALPRRKRQHFTFMLLLTSPHCVPHVVLLTSQSRLKYWVYIRVFKSKKFEKNSRRPRHWNGVKNKAIENMNFEVSVTGPFGLVMRVPKQIHIKY